MNEMVETCTGVHALGVGDPTLVPAFSAAQVADPGVPAPHWRADTGANGAYLLQLFLDEEPPVGLAAYLREPDRVERLLVPSGRLLVAGEEAFYGATPAERYGREVEVPAGEYQLVACRVHAPDDLVERRFAEQATPAQLRAWRMGQALRWISAGSVLLALPVGWLLRGRLGVVLAVLALLALAGFLLVRNSLSPAFVSAAELRRTLQRQLPAFTVVLHRLG